MPTADLLPQQAVIKGASCPTGYTIAGGGCIYFTTTNVGPAATDNKVSVAPQLPWL